MKTKNSKFGFSLIELSIVILIIGILVTGITKGSRIISASKLKTAQSLTNSSPVNSIDDLVIWLEATSDKSFTTSEAVDTAIGTDGTITTWNDINPHITTPNNATQNTVNNKPRYRARSINGLPSLNFDGVTEFMNFNGTSLANSSHTIFVVEKKSNTATFVFFLGSGDYPGGVVNSMILVGYRSAAALTLSQYSNDLDYPLTGTHIITRIHSHRLKANISRDYYVNGVKLTSSGGGNSTPPTAYNSATIGALYSGGGLYPGDIGEIIIFKRYLTNTERLSVENYLKAKWGVK